MQIFLEMTRKIHSITSKILYIVTLSIFTYPYIKSLDKSY